MLFLYFSISLEKYNFFDRFLIDSKSFLQSWYYYFVFLFLFLKNFEYKRCFFL